MIAMIGIKNISRYIPSGRINNLERAEFLGSTPDQVRDKIGFHELSRLANGETALDMAEKALRNLLSESDVDSDTVQALVVVGQNPDRNIPHLSAELHGRARFSINCAAFDLGLGCSGYVYGLSVLAAFMGANGLKRGVLITTDPYSRIVDPDDKATAMIFGDAATATLLDDDPLYDLGKFAFGTQGVDANKIACNDGVLSMNGRAVFNFAAIRVPANIVEAVSLNSLNLNDIDCFVLHQGSRYIVETISDRLKVSRNIVPFSSSHYGNTISSSIPLVLSDQINNPDNRNILLCGFGLGLSWGSVVVRRRS